MKWLRDCNIAYLNINKKSFCFLIKKIVYIPPFCSTMHVSYIYFYKKDIAKYLEIWNFLSLSFFLSLRNNKDSLEYK